MTSERECQVYLVLPGQTELVTAGRFRLEGRGAAERGAERVGRFVYGRRYRERPDAVELDPVELRLTSSVQETGRMGGFFGAIRDALPDHWGRRVIERHAGPGPLDDFDLLLQGPDDRAGALAFGLGVEPPAPRRRFNERIELEAFVRAAEALLEDDAPAPFGRAAVQVEEALLLGTSMGGARPKLVIADEGELWLAKLGRPDDRWNHPRVEHGLLELARACGLRVADSRLERVAGRDVLFVRRFDRERVDAGYRRHRMVSALTLLRAGDSATERRRWSYLLFADELRRVSADPEGDLRELFGRACFNAAVSNLDDHPRNHALVASGRPWRLSPAYDLTPTPSVSRDRRDLAMTCGRFGRLANRENLLSAPGRFRLSEDEAARRLDEIVEVVRREWRAVMRRAAVSEADCERIASAFVYEGFFDRTGQA